MKTKSLINALNKILRPTKTIEGNTAYIVGNKRVVVIDQDGSAIAFPMVGAKVVHNGNYTIKNLVSFVTGLDDAKIDYLKTVKSMYGSANNEKLIEMANQFTEMGE